MSVNNVFTHYQKLIGPKTDDPDSSFLDSSETSST